MSAEDPIDATDSLLPRFSGTDSRPRLIDALCDQTIIRGERDIANEVAEICSLHEIQAGQYLIYQDGCDNDVFLILSGSFHVVVNGRRVAQRFCGEHIGEMALIDTTARRSASAVAAEPSIVAKCPTDAFSNLANNFPQVWRRIAVELSRRLKERNALQIPPHNQPVLFIGSSSEALDVTREVQNHFQHDPFVVRPWTIGVFTPSSTPIESLVKAVSESDFGVMIVTGDDKLESRGEHSEAPRDNVIFELGLLIGTIGRGRTFMLCPKGKDIKIPTDILGVAPFYYDYSDKANLDTKLGPACNELRKQIKTLGPR